MQVLKHFICQEGSAGACNSVSTQSQGPDHSHMCITGTVLQRLAFSAEYRPEDQMAVMCSSEAFVQFAGSSDVRVLEAKP